MIDGHGPRLPARAGGADAAVATGRARRRRRRVAAAAAGTALVAVTAFAFVSLGPGDGERGLDPVAEPTRPTRPARLPRDGRAWVGATPDGAEFVTIHDPAACAPRDTEDGFCAYVEAPATVVPRTEVTLGFRVCRATGTTPAPLDLPAPERLSLIVTAITPDGEGLDWVWPYDDDAAPFARTFAPGECLAWRVRWAGQARDGFALPAGPAAVSAQFSGEPHRGAAAPPLAQADITIAPAP